MDASVKEEEEEVEEERRRRRKWMRDVFVCLCFETTS